MVGRLRLRFGGDVWDAEPELLVRAEPERPELPVRFGLARRPAHGHARARGE